MLRARHLQGPGVGLTLGLAAPGDASERLQISCQIKRLLWRLDSCYAVSSSYTALPEECGVRLQCLIFPANGSLVFPANGSRELPVQGRRQGGLARARTSQPGVGCGASMVSEGLYSLGAGGLHTEKRVPSPPRPQPTWGQATERTRHQANPENSKPAHGKPLVPFLPTQNQGHPLIRIN